MALFETFTCFGYIRKHSAKKQCEFPNLIEIHLLLPEMPSIYCTMYIHRWNA